jgi:hypothetical protein
MLLNLKWQFISFEVIFFNTLHVYLLFHMFKDIFGCLDKIIYFQLHIFHMSKNIFELHHLLNEFICLIYLLDSTNDLMFGYILIRTNKL